MTAKTPSQPTEDTSSRRKREREGSLEPTQLTPSRAAEAIPAKKNRVEDSLQEEDDDEAGTTAVETEKVGQIRKKVDELSTKELELKSAQSATNLNTAEPVAQSKNAVADAALDATAAPQSEPAAAASAANQPKSAEAQQQSQPKTHPPALSHLFLLQLQVIPIQLGSFFLGLLLCCRKQERLLRFCGKELVALVGSGIKPSSLGSSIGGHHDENGSASRLPAPPSLQHQPRSRLSKVPHSVSVPLPELVR